ncbi:unnamed protein product, partial [Sphacelaria rigidula]
MVSVMNKKFVAESCSRKPSYSVAGSKKVELCSERASSAMMTVVNERCSEEGCSKGAIHKNYDVGKATFCRQHASAYNIAMVSDTTKLDTEK